MKKNTQIKLFQMPKLWCSTIKNNLWISESKWEIVKDFFLRLWRGLAPRHEDPCRMVKSHFGKTRHFSHAIHPLTKPLIFSKCLSKTPWLRTRKCWPLSGRDAWFYVGAGVPKPLRPRISGWTRCFWLELPRSVEINTLRSNFCFNVLERVQRFASCLPFSAVISHRWFAPA